MPKSPKILLSLLLIIFIFQLTCLFVLLTIPELSQAAEKANFVPQVGIGADFQKGTNYTTDGSTALIGQYIRAIYKYAIGIIGILAAVILMFGGVLWLTAGGNTERISNAKAWIGASLTGLLLALCSFLLLATINPALVEFKITKVDDVIEPIKKGCCQWVLKSGGNDGCANSYTQFNCEAENSGGPESFGKYWGELYTCTGRTQYDTCEQTLFPKSECPSGFYPDYCIDCLNCVTLEDYQIPYKSQNCGNKINREVAISLHKAYNSKTVDWEITEAWPPTVRHVQPCQYNGTCVDINLTNKSTDKYEVKAVFNNLKTFGFTPEYELDEGVDCNPYRQLGVTCINVKRVLPHFSAYHVKFPKQ